MISLVISCLALAISLAPHVKRLVTRKRRTFVVLGEGCNADSHRTAAMKWSRAIPFPPALRAPDGGTK